MALREFINNSPVNVHQLVGSPGLAMFIGGVVFISINPSNTLHHYIAVHKSHTVTKVSFTYLQKLACEYIRIHRIVGERGDAVPQPNFQQNHSQTIEIM